MATVRSEDGTALNVLTDGDDRNPALVFIHGFAQSAAAWQRQVDAFKDDFFVVRMELRGHGDSGKPADPAAYGDSQRWADDVAVVLRDLELRTPILIGWSYAGRIIADYLEGYGSEAIVGIALVGAVSLSGVPVAQTFRDPALRPTWQALCDADDAIGRAGFTAFSRRCFARPVADTLIEEMTKASMRLPVHARRAMLARTMDSTAAWAAYTKPALIIHGAEDAVVLPASADWHATQLPLARSLRYDGVGHAPFVEDAERFNADLRAFASDALGTVSR